MSTLRDSSCVNDPATAIYGILSQNRYCWVAGEEYDADTVLDIGCAAGYGSRVLAEGGYQVTALDRDVSAIRYGLNKYDHPLIQFTVGDATNLPFADATFDLVVCFEVIEHVHSPETALSEIRRVLRPTGTAIVSTPNTNVFTGASSRLHRDHVQDFTPESFHAAVSQVFSHIEIWGQHWTSQAQHTHNRVNAAITRLKRKLGLTRPLLPRRWHSELSRWLFGLDSGRSVGPVTTPEITHDNVEEAAILLAVCHCNKTAYEDR